MFGTMSLNRLFCFEMYYDLIGDHAPAAEAPGVQRAVLREEEGVVGPQRDQRDRQRQLASADQEVN